MSKLSLNTPLLDPHRTNLEALATVAERHSFEVWIVGGSVRDLLLGLPVADLDVVTQPEATRAFRRDLAEAMDAAQVTLDEERGIYRLVPRDKGPHLDVCRLQGTTLEHDLRLRDFTLNAMALPVVLEGEVELVDLFDGQKHLQDRQLRLVSPAVFEHDPLRLMRAARMVAAFGLTIDDETIEIARAYSHLLPKVAQERITEELLKIFLAENMPDGLELLQKIHCLHTSINMTDHETFRRFDAFRAYRELLEDKRFQKLMEELLERQTDDSLLPLEMSMYALLLRGLLPSLAKSPPRNLERQLTQRLRLSSRNAKLLAELMKLRSIKGLPKAPDVCNKWFWECGDRGMWAAVIDCLWQGKDKKQTLSTVQTLLKKWKDDYLERVLQGPMISGNDLLEADVVKKGPALGRMARRLHWYAFIGEFETPREGIRFARQLRNNEPPDPPGGIFLEREL